MVFKPDFSFNPRPVTPTGPRSRSISPKASYGRTPYAEDGEVSPSSNDPSVMSSSWSSKRSSMTSLTYSLRRECHPSASTVSVESVVVSNGPIISPIRIRFDDENYGYGEENEDEMERKSKASAIKASILRGFHPFPFSSKAKKTGSAPASPKSPETPPVRTSTKSNNQNTRATVNARFRLFKSAPKRTKNSRRPPPLNLQNLPSVSSSRPIRETENPSLASPIKLDNSSPALEHCDFSRSPEAGVQLLFQTLSEESDQEDTLDVERVKEKDTTSAYLASPWFTASQGPSAMIEATEKAEVKVIKFAKSYLPVVPSKIYGNIPRSPPLSPKSQQQPTTKLALAAECSSSRPASPIVQPPTPRSARSANSFLFDEGDETDIEDSPADFYARRPSPATSRRSSLSVSRRSSPSVSRRSSISGSRKSSIATFFCRGQRPSLGRSNSIGLGGLTGDEVEIKDDAESVFYPGISELKCKSSWLYNNTPEYSSSDDEDDSDYEIEENYQRHFSLITHISKKSASTLATSITSTPELTMSSSVSPVSSYGQMLAAPERRRNRRRTASSECIVLEALEEMQAIGLKDSEGVENMKSRGLGFLGDMDIGSEWTDALWEMDSDEQAGWDWETQQVTLIGV